MCISFLLFIHVHVLHTIHKLCTFLFQGQIHEAQEFQRVLSSYKPELEQLSHLATVQAQSSGGDGGEEGPSVPSKMAEIQQSYDQVKALMEERRSMLESFMPSVQQYNSSRGAWEDLLYGWEEKAAALPPPAASPKAIQGQIDDIKVMQNNIMDKNLRALCRRDNCSATYCMYM